MSTPANRSATLALAVALAALSLPALAQMDHSKMAHQMSSASTAYMDAMAKMDTDMKAMQMTGKPGADFAMMMIPHHQSAIDMAKAYLESGENDPELTKLSQDIIAAQEKEIAFLKGWLEKNADK
ncbi:DUF305 domain-containing protein [Mesorhizobium sp. J428]|uniref:DUF305 domain-containing protein n=1 Tax=Mesorhizobium sp. J428 TaxID=2898440 RepID=UPI002150C67B|nr:DUF305 domain-containing protein [Mesorhizobium sp. J428]MCR5855436.1 DUF305 domain-containing protein [Mesorhizobium sp. J428]